MRALLLVVVGIGLIWLLIQGFGPSLAKEPESQEAGGVLLVEPPRSSSANVASEAVDTANPGKEPPSPQTPAARPVTETASNASTPAVQVEPRKVAERSEERRVGKEC